MCNYMSSINTDRDERREVPQRCRPLDVIDGPMRPKTYNLSRGQVPRGSVRLSSDRTLPEEAGTSEETGGCRRLELFLMR